MSKQTYDGVKVKSNKKEPLELLQLVMYGNRNTGDVDQAYEELKQTIKSMDKLIKLYSYLNENANDYDLNVDEVDDIEQQIKALEEELK